MLFKNMEVSIGDLARVQINRTPSYAEDGVVVHINEHAIVIFNVDLAVSGGQALFSDEEVERIEILLPAKDAIPQESDSKRFAQHQRVLTVIKGQEMRGNVIAALQGFIFVKRNDGRVIAGGASSFKSEEA